MRKHGDIETILESLDQTKYPPPENWLFSEARSTRRQLLSSYSNLHSRRLFKTPDVTPASEIDLKWEKPDEEGLVAYMCGEKGFQVGITSLLVCPGVSWCTLANLTTCTCRRSGSVTPARSW